jgi:hypothetical protein
MYIVLYTILVYVCIAELNFPIVINIALIILILITEFLREHSDIIRNCPSDFKIRSNGRKLNYWLFFYAIFWTVIIVTLHHSLKLLLILIWLIVIMKIIMHFVYKFKKPYTLFIKDNELIISSITIQKRNLIDLKQIQYDRNSKSIILVFKSKNYVALNPNSYNAEDFNNFLEILIQKSEHPVFVPKNYLEMKADGE